MSDPVEREAIALRGVTKRYRLYGSALQMAADQLGYYRLRFWRRPPAFQEFEALCGITLDVRHGERVGLIGRNGAGKTTLLKLLTRNFAPTAGEVRVDGTVQALMQIGLGFHPEFTGYDNIRSALVYNGLSGENLAAAIEEIVDFAELGDFLHQPMKTYSLGMTTRLQFAAATAIRPDILVVDEILGAGDSYFSTKSAHRMRKLTSSGCTLLLVSHSTDQILQFCERAVWLEKGRVESDGKALDVVRAYEEFVERMRHRQHLQEPAGPAQAGDFATPQWQQEAMAAALVGETESLTVSRWPGEEGLKIVRVSLTDGAGTERLVFAQGQSIRFVVTVVAERPGTYPVRFALLLMTVSGVGVARMLSPQFEVVASDRSEYEFCVELANNPFTAQELVFSIGAFRIFEPTDPQSAVRYDLLSRSFKFRITGGIPNDPGVVFLSGKWSASAERKSPSETAA